MQLPEIDEIVDAVHSGNPGDLEPTYQEYLDRLKEDYLERSRTLDFLVKVGIAASSNIANVTTVLVACELGIDWFASASLGFGFGMIPAAYYLNKAGIRVGEGFEVREPGSLLTAAVLTLSGGAIAWNAASEKRILIQFADEGQKQSAKIIAEYEVKSQPWNDLFESIGNFFNVSTNWIALLVLVFVVWRWLKR
jgi:hypothetical protein